MEAPQFQPLQMPERAVPAPGEAGAGAAAEEGYKSKVPALEENLVDQLSRDEQEMLKTKHKAAEEADKKVGWSGCVCGMVDDDLSGWLESVMCA